MSKSMFADSAQQCGRPLQFGGSPQTIGTNINGTYINVLCTRPARHSNEAHEFVGTVGGSHIHIIWGEPGEPR